MSISFEKTVKTDKHQITYLKFETNHPDLNWEIAVKFELNGFRDPEFLVKQPQWKGYLIYEGAWTDEYTEKGTKLEIDHVSFENAESLEVQKMQEG